MTSLGADCYVGQLNYKTLNPPIMIGVDNLQDTCDIGNTTTTDIIMNGGKLGVGATPDLTLHVNSGSSNECARFESTDTEVSLELKDTTGTATLKSRNDYRFTNGSGELMRVSALGKVGIGVNGDAADKLVVQEDSAVVTPIVVLKNDNTTDDNGIFIDFSGKDNANNNIIFSRIGTKYTNHATEKSQLNFWNRNNAGSLVETMRLSHDGDLYIPEGKLGVGISPVEMLDVKSSSGDCRLRMDCPAGSDTEIKLFEDGSVKRTIGYDAASDRDWETDLISKQQILQDLPHLLHQ